MNLRKAIYDYLDIYGHISLKSLYMAFPDYPQSSVRVYRWEWIKQKDVINELLTFKEMLDFLEKDITNPKTSPTARVNSIRLYVELMNAMDKADSSEKTIIDKFVEWKQENKS